MSFAAMPKRVLTPEEVQRYQSDGALMVRQALEPNWLQLIEAGVEQARRALALRWTGDDVVYSPSKRRMPIHYRHHSIVGGPLRGAAFPRILPSMLADERQARLGREHSSVLGLLGSGWDNFAAALALKLRGVEVRASQGGRP